ncbi:TPA: hypothetical protein R4169_000620 [Klebsiella pneumoniae]|nr:hypothetical protein [Klebsiella pneumoniae]HED3570549.1 hypothetical protein [Klebsiella pneumoniae]HED3614208.1 hypothetical protein [Klebsiella pneumoniae]HED3640516.1 hypothetical protein [Klebsiella pneumoniae]HED3651734.1 hypothetical protein [Klebsiella pneumoniae]
MTDITELAQRVEHIISDVKLKHGGNDTYAPIMKWDELIALVEALERAQQRIDSQREYYEGVIADGGKRIADLESRTVKLPEPEQWDITQVLLCKKKVVAAIRAAGIKVEAE